MYIYVRNIIFFIYIYIKHRSSSSYIDFVFICFFFFLNSHLLEHIFVLLTANKTKTNQKSNILMIGFAENEKGTDYNYRKRERESKGNFAICIDDVKDVHLRRMYSSLATCDMMHRNHIGTQPFISNLFAHLLSR